MARTDWKKLLYNWFDYKVEDDTKRPIFIEQKLNIYENGEWIVGEEK